MSTETKWYYADGDNSVGPIDRQTIGKMTSAGMLNIETQVIPEGGGTWSRLGDSALKDLISPVPPSTPERPKPFKKESNWVLQNVIDFVCAFSGLKPLTDFKWSYLVQEAIKRHSRLEADDLFDCGCPQNTPDIMKVRAEWPRPWFFLRLLAFGLLILIGFYFGLQQFGNPRLLPGLMIVGAFFVPLTCVALFYELNVLRNISLYQVIRFILFGGVASLIIALFLYDITKLDFLGAMSAGLVEETAKVLTAVALLRRTERYKWILNGILVGAAVGAGFAGFESAGYIFMAFFNDLGAGNSSLPGMSGTLVERALFAPFCHVVWTASVVGALWRVKGDQPFRVSMFFKSEFYRILAFVIVIHMLWNSGLLWAAPGNIFQWRLELFIWPLSLFGSWYLALLLVQEGLAEVRTAQSAITEPSNSNDLVQQDSDCLESGPHRLISKMSVKNKMITAGGVIVALITFGLVMNMQSRDPEYSCYEAGHQAGVESRRMVAAGEIKYVDASDETEMWGLIGMDLAENHANPKTDGEKSECVRGYLDGLAGR